MRVLMLLIFCLVTDGIVAQKFLQLEKSGSLKRTRFYPGETLKFSFRSDPKIFYTREIIGLNVGQQEIFFPDVIVPIDSIYAVQLIGSNSWAKRWSRTLLVFSASWAVYNVADVLYSDRRPQAFHYVVGGASFALSWILRWFIKERRKKIGKKNRLRILDLSFSPGS
jgi:hypothetical protein